MIWTKDYEHLLQYQYVSSNQHGNRYKIDSSKRLNVATLSCETNSSEIETLILLSHTLNVPVHYDFEDHTAYIEVMSADAVRGNI